MNVSKSLLIVFVLFFWAFAARCGAQAHEATENECLADKWAVVIGDGVFKNPEWNIKYARKDATDFHDYLGV